jgi:hypothetical protein
MELVKSKIDKLSKLYSDIYKYSGDISRFHNYDLETETNVSDELTNIQEILTQINTILKKISENESGNISSNSNVYIEQLFNLWHLINSITYKIDNILYELDKIARYDSKKLTYDISDSQIKVIGDLYNNIMALYKKYQRDTQKIDIDAIQSMDNTIHQKFKWEKSDTLENIELFTQIVKKYPFSINLYAFVMQKILLKCIPFGESVCNTVIDNIETIKDFIMLESVKYKPNPSRVHKSNPHIKTFGLTPHSPSNTLAILSKEVFGKSIKKDSDFEAIAKLNSLCIVVVNRIIQNPIEFNLWNVIDWKYSKPFLQSEFAGVNKKMIDRFNTITFVETKKYQAWNFNIAYYGNIDSSYITVIEKLGSDAYRLLNLYNREYSMYNVIGGGKNETKIHKKQLTEFIEYVKKKGVINNNTRISEYHKIHERNILKNMFLPAKFNIAGINLRSQIIDSTSLRHELRTKLTVGFNEIIKKEYKGGKLVKTNKDIGVIIHHPLLSNIFNSVIIEQYDIYTFKNKDNVSTFPFSETLKTFLAEVGLLNRNFIRGIHGRFTASKLDQKIFSEDNITKKIYLDKLFTEIISPVIKKEINNESNIYQSLIYKTSLLRLSIIG